MVRFKIIRAGFVLALSLALGACGLNSIDLPPPPGQAPVYRLAAGDKVSLQVFGHQDLSGQFDVGADGTLPLPLVGAVPARDRTVAELSEDLRARLNQFVVNPKFTVDVAVYRPIFVLGEVYKPGGYPYAPGLTVQQAVALAGGFTRRAITDEIVVTRLTEQGPKDYGVTPKDLVFPGDTLDVQRRVF